jgi:hypothetical protein
MDFFLAYRTPLIQSLLLKRERQVTIIITVLILLWGSSQCVDMGSATDISEAHLASVFRVNVSSVSGSSNVCKYRG